MKHTKENIIKLLKVKLRSQHTLARIWREKGDQKSEDEEIAVACEIDHIINLLTDKKYFNETVEIYKDKLGEQLC